MFKLHTDHRLFRSYFFFLKEKKKKESYLLCRRSLHNLYNIGLLMCPVVETKRADDRCRVKRESHDHAGKKRDHSINNAHHHRHQYLGLTRFWHGGGATRKNETIVI